MRLLLCCLLAAGCISTTGWTETSSIRNQIVDHLRAHPMQFPAGQVHQAPSPELILKFSVDHDGKLVDPRVDKGSGSAAADQQALEWLMSLQPFPTRPRDDTTAADFALPIRFRHSPIYERVVAYLAAHPLPDPVQLPGQPNGPDLILKFSLDHDGKLLNPQIAKGTGSAAIDQKTLDWLSTLQPFPAIPLNDPNPADFTVPIQFQRHSPSTFTFLREYYEGERKTKRAIGNVCRGC
jgi:TonB family protein